MKAKTIKKLGVAAVFLLAIVIIPALSQASKDVTFQVNLSEWYDLSISQNTITFTDIAPDISSTPSTKSIAANEGPVSVRAFAVIVPSASLQLTVTAHSDLSDGSHTIPANAISWTASGAGYQNGSLANANAVTVGSWSGSIFHWHEGTLNFSFLRNYTSQAPGNYSLTATYTLSKV
ncbi:MAG: hypothetical protein ACPLZD_07520 [Candidatus Saccharicenans sp.]